MTPRPRIALAQLPTPIQPLPRLSETLGGTEIWVKRDDLTGLAFGGNKTRKLELLVAEAQAANAGVLLTRGARQSNHCRQTAATAAAMGMGCTLILSGDPPSEANANLLLDQILGADIRWAGGDDPELLLQETFQEKLSNSQSPFLIPYGGSSPVGASAYADAFDELLTQDQVFDRIVFATSSGGTQAGLLAGALKNNTEICIDGISVDLSASQLVPQISLLSNQVLELLEVGGEIKDSDVNVDDRFRGAGYAVVGDLEVEAVRLFAQLEGLLLDPVYTGRAAGGMIAKIRSGEIASDERVLFWHTGGTPAIFAYGPALMGIRG